MGWGLDRRTIQLEVDASKFFDLQVLAYRNALEVLVCFAGGPEDIDAVDQGMRPESDVLLDGIRAEGTALADGSEDGARLASIIRYGDLDLGA
jgi:hypothetical protein